VGRGGAWGGEVKDRIGNVLEMGDKVLIELPTSSIVGFIADLAEPGLVAVRRGSAANMTPGRVLVSCVVALPVDGEYGAVPQLVKVYDAAKEGHLEPSENVLDRFGSKREN
jgi:hypothetical protein